MYVSELLTAIDALLAVLLNYSNRAKLIQLQVNKVNTSRVGLRLNIAELNRYRAKKVDILDFLTILVSHGQFNYYTMY